MDYARYQALHESQWAELAKPVANMGFVASPGGNESRPEVTKALDSIL
jgi:hypothetical protein